MTKLEKELIKVIIVQAKEIDKYQTRLLKAIGVDIITDTPLSEAIDKMTQPIAKYIQKKKEYRGNEEEVFNDALFGGDFKTIIKIIEELESSGGSNNEN